MNRLILIIDTISITFTILCFCMMISFIYYEDYLMATYMCFLFLYNFFIIKKFILDRILNKG